jgi:hypothetical protein
MLNPGERGYRAISAGNFLYLPPNLMGMPFIVRVKKSYVSASCVVYAQVSHAGCAASDGDSN